VGFFEEEVAFYLVMEHMYGGDLFNGMISQTKYTKHNVRILARALLEAVMYIHEQQVAHCDLKLLNIMLQSDDDQVLVSELPTLALPVMLIRNNPSQCGAEVSTVVVWCVCCVRPVNLIVCEF